MNQHRGQKQRARQHGGVGRGRRTGCQPRPPEREPCGDQGGNTLPSSVEPPIDTTRSREYDFEVEQGVCEKGECDHSEGERPYVVECYCVPSEGAPRQGIDQADHPGGGDKMPHVGSNLIDGQPSEKQIAAGRADRGDEHGELPPPKEEGDPDDGQNQR